MKTLQDKVDQLSELVRIYSNFLEIWKDKLPEGCNATFGTVGAARLNFFCYNNDRQIVLSKVADVFGREGWTRKANSHQANEFDWTKTVNELIVWIHSAEVVELSPCAVQPKAFPPISCNQ